MSRALLSTAVFFVSLPLFAQIDPDVNDPANPTVKSEIVVTASSVPEEVATSPANVTVITRKEIEQRKERDLAELLREVPGIVLSRYGSEGKATSLFMRGAESTHTLVMWNGIELNNPYFAGYDWGQFSTAGIEQVEIVRGPYSALYGSDAYAGAINVLSGNRGNDFDLDIQAGENGLMNILGDLSFASGSISGNVAYDTRNDDGFYRNDDYDQQTINGGLTWATTNNFSIGLQARQSDYDLGIPFNTNAAGDAFVPTLRRRQNGNETQYAVPIRHAIGRFSYELTLSQTELDYDFSDPDDPFGYTSASTEARSQRVRLVTRTRAGFLGTIAVGGEYELSEVDAVDVFGPVITGRERKAKSFFVEDRFSHTFASNHRLEISAGVRSDDFEEIASEISPRMGIAYLVGSYKFRAAYGEGFRAPALAELYYPFGGNQQLEPEHSSNIELGVDQFISRDSSLSLTFFRSDYENLISIRPPNFTYVNFADVRSQGAELGLRTLAGGFGVSASYTYLDAVDRETKQDRLRRPRHSGSLVLSRESGRMNTTLAIVHSGERRDVLPVLPFTPTGIGEAYTRGDVTVQYELQRLTPYVRIENVTNESYEEILGFPAPGRRALFGLHYSLK